MTALDLSTSTLFATFCEKSLESSKAAEISRIDVSAHSSLTDVMLIATGTSSRHVSAICERLEEHLHKAGVRDVTLSGSEAGGWVIADVGNVMVHVLRPEERERYQLDTLYRCMAAGVSENALEDVA